MSYFSQRSNPSRTAAKQENRLATRKKSTKTENGGANRRFWIAPGRFRRRRGVSPRTRGAVGARALDRRTLLNATVPCRSTSHTVPCLVDASPRVMTTSCPSKDCGSEERTVRNDWKIRSRAFHLRRVGGGSRDWRRRRRAWRREMIAKPITRTTHLEIRLVQPRQRMLVRRTLREARGSRQGAGQPMGVRVAKPSNEKKQRVRLRRKRARVEFRETKRSIVFRARTSRISVIAIASLEACPCVTQAFCPSIARSRPTPSPVVN